MLDLCVLRRALPTAVVGVTALVLPVSALAAAPSVAAPSVAAPSVAAPSSVAPSSVAPAAATRVALRGSGVDASAVRAHQLTARAGRAGATLGTIRVTVGVASRNPAGAGHPRVLVQALQSGSWHTVRVGVLGQVDGPSITLNWQSRRAGTLRVAVPALGLVTPAMQVPAAPASTTSRYYVRTRKGGGRAILRVFKSGLAYGIEDGRFGAACVAGRLDRPYLRLRSYDYGSRSASYKASGGWKRLRIRDGGARVGGPRRSLAGKNGRRFGRCASPTFASVTTGASAHRYPWHTNIVATTFWVGEIFDPNASDGSQMLSTYDSRWFAAYGGCDGVAKRAGCATEARSAVNGYFPRSMRPKQNPFYLDLPFDDVNDAKAYARRGSVVPWAHARGYAGRSRDSGFSYMKNRWVQLTKGARTCYGQIEDAGPGQYDDAQYVFGASDTRPLNGRYNGAGMDVSPALNGCLGFAALDGDHDRVSWRFVDVADVPAGPWRTLVTTSPVRE